MINVHVTNVKLTGLNKRKVVNDLVASFKYTGEYEIYSQNGHKLNTLTEESVISVLSYKDYTYLQ